MRAAEEDFASWFLELGNGSLTCSLASNVPDTIVPHECKILQEGNVSSEETIVNAVFNNMFHPETIAYIVILTPTDEAALKLNKLIIKKVPGAARENLSANIAISDD